MEKRKRWIKSIIETAANENTELPWQRGDRRAVFISRRNKPAAAGARWA